MLYVILIAAVVIFWLIAVDRPVLKVKFEQGQISKVKGHIPPSFKHNLQDIAEHSPFDGEMKVYNQRTGMRLTFSKDVPKKFNNALETFFLTKALSPPKVKSELKKTINYLFVLNGTHLMCPIFISAKSVS